MGLDRRMQCFIDQLFPIIWSRYLIPVEQTLIPEPSGLKFKEISPALIELLSKAIWVQSKIAFHHWVRYLRKYYDEMVSSPKMFVMYVTYACNTMSYNIQDHYERFVTVCSLLVGFGANFYYSGNGEVLRYIPQILAVFFERVLLAQFYDRGGWKRLDKYLLRQEYLNWHDEIQIECPNETPQQKVTRELNFAKKVEAAILASACKDYAVDEINEKDVECDLATVQITYEIMQYFSETSPKKKGSKKPKSSATSQPFDEAVVEANKDASKGMMELVQRARLDALLKSQRFIEEGSVSSGTVVNIAFSEAVPNVNVKTEMTKQPDSLKREEPNSKTQRTKKHKSLKTKDCIPNIPQFIQKVNEASVGSGGAVSNIINTTEVKKPDIQSEDCAGKSLKPKKHKALKIKDNLHSSPLNISILKSTEKVNEDKCIEVIEDGKLCSANKGLSDYRLQENTDNLKEYECSSNQAVIERNNKLNISDIPKTNGTFSIRKNAENTLPGEKTKTSVIQEVIADDTKQKSENIINENIPAVKVSCNVRRSKDASLNSKTNGNGSISDPEPSIERNALNETLGLEGIGAISASDTSSNTSYAKYKTKREAMNAIIRIVDNLAPKIEMFVVMLDSLVWDLKKDS